MSIIKKIKVQEIHGIVVMLDALGVRDVSIEKSRRFIESFNYILPQSYKFILAFLENMKKVKHYNEYFQGPPLIHVFGDTVALIFEAPKDDTLNKKLMIIAPIVEFIIQSGLEMGLCFRGAISIGDLVHNGQNILGPSITDAASWHEKAQWIGVVVTPHCGQYLSYLQENWNNIFTDNEKGIFGKLEKFFVRYEVPLKEGCNCKMWVVNWISWMKREPNPITWYFSCTKNLPIIPLGAEAKYDNTEKFLHWIVEKHYNQL